MRLLVPNILFFRHLAGRALKKQLSAQGSSASSRSEGNSASTKRPSLDLAAPQDAATDQNSPKEGALKEMTKESELSHASSTRYVCCLQHSCQHAGVPNTRVCCPWISDCSASFT